MQQYLDLLSHVMDNGADRMDRTGTGTRGVFGYQMRFDLADGLNRPPDQSAFDIQTRRACPCPSGPSGPRHCPSHGIKGRDIAA